MHAKLYGMKELADLLGISKQTLYARMKNGSLFYGNDIPEPAYEIAAAKIWTHEQLVEKINAAGHYSDWSKVKDKLSC